MRVRCFVLESKCSKRAKTRFLGILECIGCVRGKNSLCDSRGELLSINANVGTRGCDVFDRKKKVQKSQNMMFGHIGVYWVRSCQKLTSWFARRNFVN